MKIDLDRLETRSAEIWRLLDAGLRYTARQLWHDTMWSLIKDPSSHHLIARFYFRWCGVLWLRGPEYFIAVNAIPLNSVKEPKRLADQELKLLSAFVYALHKTLVDYIRLDDCTRAIEMVWRVRRMLQFVTPPSFQAELYQCTVLALKFFEREWHWHEMGYENAVGSLLNGRFFGRENRSGDETD